MPNSTATRFALMMPWGRVGSNLLTSTINANSAVKVLNEPTTGIRTRGQAAGLSFDQIRQEQLQHLESFVEDQGPDGHARGVKLSYRSLVDRTAYLQRLAALDFRMVVMVRDNFLKCAISQRRALARVAEAGKDGKWSSAWLIKSTEPVPPAISIGVEETVRVTSQFETIHYEMLGRIGAVFGSNYHLVRYEDLLEDQEATIRKVFDYLGLQQPEKIEIKQRKATSDKPSDDILNYDELSTAMIEAGMGRYV